MRINLLNYAGSAIVTFSEHQGSLKLHIVHQTGSL